MSGRLAEAVNFFFYDTAKIFILLAVIIFAVAIVRSFFPAERARVILSHEKKYIGNVAAALLGIVTPFCTCSAIPLFLGFVEAGIPLGVTFSFLISSPMINEVALVMLWGMFGWKIAVIYIASGFVIAVVSGIVLGELKLEGLLENIEPKKRATDALLADPSWKDRFRYALRYTADILRTVGPFVIIGIAIGAFIHGYAPQDFLVKYAGKGNWLAVPVATLIGIPLYSNAAGTIPMVSALVEKGMGIGTALAFMMAVTGLSLPEFLILRRVMKTRLLLIFAAIVGIGIIFTGYLFNFIAR